MTGSYEFELGRSADSLVNEMLKLKQNEVVAITADTESDERVVNATARAAFSAGAKPIVVWVPAPLGVGKDADPMLPVNALGALLKECDAWVEFNNKWLLYSTPFEIAIKENRRIRYICLVGMNADMMVNLIGRVNNHALKKLLKKVAGITQKVTHVKIVTPGGTNIEFDNDPDRELIVHCGDIPPGKYEMLPGQISWAPVLESINDTIVFDGSIVPPIGLLKERVKLTIRKGRIERIDGGVEAREFESFLKRFNDPNMFRLAHVSYGFNPGAKLTGNVVEDERIWGCTEWGIGYVGPRLIPPDGIPAKSHTDGICSNSSAWLDDLQMMDKGKVFGPKELVDLSNLLTKETGR